MIYLPMNIYDLLAYQYASMFINIQIGSFVEVGGVIRVSFLLCLPMFRPSYNVNIYYICNYTSKNKITNLKREGQKSLFKNFYDPSGIIEFGDVIKLSSLL